ncbi:hypothetical protein, partial [Paraclostridium bifermentans]|uniref:hypothetical protein n=1 Tax=Paraclostridium bifermentans TaxID=1490 RepID=UPI00374F673F
MNENNKRQVVKSCSIALESNSLDSITVMLESLSKEDLLKFLEQYQNTEEYKDNHSGVQDYYIICKEQFKTQGTISKSVTKEIAKLLIEDFHRKQFDVIMHTDIGQMLFGWVNKPSLDVTESFNETQERIRKTHKANSKLRKYITTKQDNVKAIKDSDELANLLMSLSDEGISYYISDYIDTNNVKDIPKSFEDLVNKNYEKIHDRRNLVREAAQCIISSKEDLKTRMHLEDSVRTLHFGEDTRDKDIISSTMSKLKSSKTSKTNIPSEYFDIAINNARYDKFNIQDYLEILLTDAINKGTLASDIIEDNKYRLINDLETKQLSFLCNSVYR